MGTQVDGNVNTVFYCYDKGNGNNKGHAGWYKIDSTHHAVPISEGDARALGVDVHNPPTLNGYWRYNLDPRSDGGQGASDGKNRGPVDLEHFSTWLAQNGGYMTEDELKELVENSTFKGKSVTDARVLDTAKALKDDDNGLFRKIDRSSLVGGGDGIIATWDIQGTLTGGQLTKDGKVTGPTNVERFSSWLASNGTYMNEDELKVLVETGQFKGKDVTDPLVLQAARELYANDNYLFKRIDAVNPDHIDNVIAPWDISPAPPVNTAV